MHVTKVVSLSWLLVLAAPAIAAESTEGDGAGEAATADEDEVDEANEAPPAASDAGPEAQGNNVSQGEPNAAGDGKNLLVSGNQASQAPAAQESMAAAEGAAPQAAKPDFSGDGQRISVRDGDFSLVPPKGWEVFTHLPTLTLLMQVPHEPGMRYQRTIQVAGFSGPRYIDEVTAKEYEEVIVRKFSQTTASIENYKIRNHTDVEMTDGRPGLLFYTEFALEGVPMMQAHILVSSSERHYLLTYTDVAEHFEKEGANQFLNEAWEAMISVQLGGRTPSRFEAAGIIVFGAGILLLLASVGMLVRRHKAGTTYRNFVEGKDLGSDPPESRAPETFSGVSSLSRMESSDVKPLRKGRKNGKMRHAETSEPLELEDGQDDIAV